MATLTVHSPLAGWALPRNEIPDPAFAQGVVGDGLGIDPTGDVVHAPCAGVVQFVPGHRHALSLRVDGGAVLLLHVGIDTVALGGAGFEALVADGARVQPGQPLMSIVADTGVWISANFKETQLADIRVGQPVEIDVDAYGGSPVEGVVESLSAATGATFSLIPPDNATGNFTKVVQRIPIRIRVTDQPDPEAPLRPGMSAEVVVTTTS